MTSPQNQSDHFQYDNEKTEPHDEQIMQSYQDEMETHFNTTSPLAKYVSADEIDDTVDPDSLEDIPPKQGERKKSFMETANVRTKQMQEKLTSQAGRLRSKMKNLKKTPKPESPKVKERKKFRSPDFAKNIKMPKIHKPEFKRPDFKRPEFTKFKTPEFKKPDFSKITLPDRPKFSKPDMSKFKLPERFTSMRLTRSKSLKEEPTVSTTEDSTSLGTGTTEDRPPVAPKKRFDFGTYPRIFDRLRRQSKPESSVSVSRDGDEDEESDRVVSPVQFGTFPKMGRKKSPPVAQSGDASSTRWSSNVSYGTDNDSGQYQRYSSEPDGIERETSVERRMRQTMKDSSLDYEDDEQELEHTGIVTGVDMLPGQLQTEEQRQLAEYDEENRVIHQISRAREDEFRQRKPLVHQDSDLMSEASVKDFGWIENDQLRKRLEARSSGDNIQRDEYIGGNDSIADKDRESVAETQSSGSSSNRRRKGVIEEIDDDEFYLRKKGISQDDIQLGRYISSAIRDGSEAPSATQLRQYDDRYYDDYDNSNEQVGGYDGYDVPPTKPRRVKDFEKSLESEEFNQDDQMGYDNEDFPHHSQSVDYGKTFPPNRPLRRIRQPYSEDREPDYEHEVPVAAQYYPHPDEEEDDDRSFYDHEHDLEDVKEAHSENILFSHVGDTPPVAPKRRKKLLRESMDREMAVAEDYLGRSVSNNFIPNGNVDDVSFMED